MKGKKGKGRVRRKLTDRYIDAVTDFIERGDPATVVWDARVPELKIRMGSTKTTWIFYAEHKRRGDRSYTARRLGYWPQMSVTDARKAARSLGGRMIDGRIETSRKDALTFPAAWADYLKHLHDQAVARGKPPTWHRIAQGIGERYLLPQFRGWSLAEISKAPEAVRDWHRGIEAKIVSNKAARLLRACYRFSARLRRDLPPELPTSGVTMNPEKSREVAMTAATARQWAAKWRQIDDPTRRAFQAVAALTGQRPGELSRVRLKDVHDDHFLIPMAKAENAIYVPFSPWIKRAITMAKVAAGESKWLFPTRNGRHLKRFDADDLPLSGMELRHNYKNIAITMRPAVPEVLTELLQGHTPKGVSRKYFSTMVVAQSEAMREAQERISDRIVSMLGLTEPDFQAS